MNSTCWRVTYNGIDVYDALKYELFNKSLNDEWNELVSSKEFDWLSEPLYVANSSSYFTDLGFNIFKEITYPIIVKYLDEENIIIEKFDYDENDRSILYSDEHQIVVVE